LANERYSDAWCDNESDVALTRLLEDEEIKERAFANTYCSLPIRVVKQQFVHEDLAARYGSWAPEPYLSPARRAQLDDELEGQRARFWAIRQEYVRLQQEARAAELEAFGTDKARGVNNSAAGVFSLIAEMEDEFLSPLGFSFDPTLSSRPPATYSVELDPTWKLCTVFPDRHRIYPRQFGSAPNGSVAIWLALAVRGSKVGNLETALAKATCRVWTLPPSLFVRFRDREPAVVDYHSARELEVVLRFQLGAITLIAPLLMQALRAALRCF
jgi:hypothetical protein